MRRFSKINCGFTLIEILIVIIVIGVLATIIFSQYAMFSRKAKLNALMDDIAAYIKEAKDKTVSGYRFREDPNQPYNCYGVSFNRNSLNVISSVVGNYQENFRNCGFASGDSASYFNEYVFPVGFQVNKIFTARQSCDSEVIVYFMPPDGTFGAVCRGPGYIDSTEQYIHFEVGQAGLDVSSLYVKRLEIEYPSGRMEVVE